MQTMETIQTAESARVAETQEQNSNKTGDSSSPRASKAMKLLEEGISEITDSESFKRYLAFSRSFTNYSVNNTMLIWLQAPEATMVAGYKRWKALGRQVRKGEKAIRILAPIVRKETDPDTGDVESRVVGFRDANVFAAEQTDSVDGEPLPSPPLTGRVEAGEEEATELYSLLSGICAFEGVEVSEKELGPGHYGYHNPVHGGIVISSNIPEVRKATTLCHELCHYLLHPLQVSMKLDKETKETEAEGASFVICSQFGIDTSAFSFPYVARHAEEPQTLRGVLDRIQKVVGQVLEYTEQAEYTEADGVAPPESSESSGRPEQAAA
jgi:antirestriction protein ArdC